MATKILGLNTEDEMRLPPDERPVKIGSEMKMSVTKFMLDLNQFFEDVLEKAGGFVDEDGAIDWNCIDTMEMARDLAVKRIREQWKREWDGDHQGKKEET